jgi:hypothetical protein
MHHPNRLVQAAVLASSILLVGVFVAYRANAFGSWRGFADSTDNNTAMSPAVIARTGASSADTRPLPDLDANPFNPPRSALEEAAALRPPINGLINGMAGEPEGIYISGPKFGPIFVPTEPAASGSGSTIMSGSKSFFVFTSPNSVPAASGSGSTIIYSSKSGTILPPPPPVQTVTGGTVMGGSKSDRVFVPQKPAGIADSTTIMMSGSKSIILTAPPSQEGQQTQQDRKKPARDTSRAAARSR